MGIESLFHLNRYAAGTKTDRHTHDYAELLYVSDGSLVQYVNDGVVHMMKGDVCFIDSGCVHWEEAGDDAFVIRLEITKEITQSAAAYVDGRAMIPTQSGHKI